MGKLSKATAIFLFNFYFLVCLDAGARFTSAQDECTPARCANSGPEIRFPFWLKGHQPEHCGYAGFEISCSATNNSEFELQYQVRASAKNLVIPLPMKIRVQEIDYKSQKMLITYVNGSCLPKQLPNVNSSATQFEISSFVQDEFVLFNCSSKNRSQADYGDTVVNCLSGLDYKVMAFASYSSASEMILSSCTKMYNISGAPLAAFDGPWEYDNMEKMYLQWSKPSCGDCEARGMYCRLKNNGTDDQTECFDIPRQPGGDTGTSKKIVIAVVVVALFVVLLISFALYHVVRFKRKREDEKKIEKFLDDYKALRPTRFSYADIKKITNQFKHKLGQGGYGTVYKGELSNDILVAVKVLNNFKGNGEEFINEVSTIGRIHHINVVRLVGYCADGYRRVLVYEFLQNDSLEKVISTGKQGNSLGWEKLQQIAIGIAKGLDYLHQGCNQRILHFDIKPHNILLDQNFNPKVADFGLAKLCSKEQSVVSMTAARGTIGYIAPEVFSRNFGSVSYKSDVYSFGMLLLDMVGGRKNFHGGDNDSSQIYYPEWMYNQLEKGGEIAIQIDKEEDSCIFKKITIVGLWCIQWYPADRPSMKIVIQMLEGENMPIMPPNPFASAKSTKTDTFASASESFSSCEIYSTSHSSEDN